MVVGKISCNVVDFGACNVELSFKHPVALKKIGFLGCLGQRETAMQLIEVIVIHVYILTII